MTTSHKLKFRSCQPKDILTIRTVNLFQYRALHNLLFFIIFLNAISASADILILSADIFIVFFYAIRRFTPKSICSFLMQTLLFSYYFTTFVRLWIIPLFQNSCRTMFRGQFKSWLSMQVLHVLIVMVGWVEEDVLTATIIAIVRSTVIRT